MDKLPVIRIAEKTCNTMIDGNGKPYYQFDKEALLVFAEDLLQSSEYDCAILFMDRLERLQMVCAAAYQMAVVADAPVRFRDVLANPLKATKEQIEALLPVQDREFDWHGTIELANKLIGEDGFKTHPGSATSRTS